MKKRIIIISIIIIIISVLVFGGYLFIKDFNEDKEKTLETMEKVKEEYKKFSPLVEKFSDARTNFYNTKEELFYLESINDNREQINTMMNYYNNIILEAHNTSKYLQENCVREYVSHSVNNTCNLFKQGYEAMMNYYKTDIELYNKMVTEYNNWLTENSYDIEPLTSLELTLHKNYIDYDNDGSYLGGK